MCETIAGVAASLEALVRGLDVGGLDAAAATSLAEEFARVQRLAAAGCTVVAGRMLEINAHHETGHRTAAELVASLTGGTLSEAIGTIAAAAALDELPAVREQILSGELSATKAGLIAQAASADPSAELELLQVAKQKTVAELRERCLMVRAAAASDETATARIRRARFFKYWTDPRDGAIRCEGRFAPDDAATFLAKVEADAHRRQLDAQRAGRFESLEACRADAVCALAEDKAKPRALAHIRVDASALERGRLAPGEVCQVEGVGPVSVDAARQMLNDSFVALIEADGEDVSRVVHFGRNIPARVRTALWERDRGRCVICGARYRLEVDHIYGWKITKRTKLEELVILCRHHHDKKTHHGWALSGGHGNWTMLPPRKRGRATGRVQPARGP